MENNKENNTSDYIHYYEVKMNAFTEYSAAVWNRFNWILTLQLGAFGLFFTEIIGVRDNIGASNIFQLLGVLICILWVLVGIHDFLSLRKHKSNVAEIDEIIKNRMQDLWNKKPKESPIRLTWLLFIFPIPLIIFWGNLITL